MKHFRAVISRQKPTTKVTTPPQSFSTSRTAATPAPAPAAPAPATNSQPTTTKMSASYTPLAGKVALVTGSSKGIGASTVTALSKLGAKVVINYGRDADVAEKLATQLGGEDSALTVQADVSTVAGIQGLVDATVAKFGKIDILIPNAGILPMKDVENTTEADFDRAFALNVKGPYFLVQKALPHIPQGGSIVLISTTQNHASTVTGNYTLYCSTKGAIEQMARLFSKDILTKGKGVRVNAVAPGPTGTDLFYNGKPENVLRAIASLNPNNRIGTPDEVADAIVYLCTDQARWVTGQTIRVNGGHV